MLSCEAMKISQIFPRLRSTEGRALSVLLTGAALALGGCASEPESHVVSAPPPAPANTVAASTGVMVQTPVVDPATGATVATQPVMISQAPPAPQSEPVLEQPSAKHVWIPGYWSYRNSRYVWIAGRWELPPRAEAVWVAPHYEREANAYRFYEGYWK